MTPIVLVQALSVEEINVRYCCMRNLYAKVPLGFTLWIGDGRRRKFCDALQAGLEWKHQLFLWTQTVTN